MSALPEQVQKLVDEAHDRWLGSIGGSAEQAERIIRRLADALVDAYARPDQGELERIIRFHVEYVSGVEEAAAAILARFPSVGRRQESVVCECGANRGKPHLRGVTPSCYGAETLAMLDRLGSPSVLTGPRNGDASDESPSAEAASPVSSVPVRAVGDLVTTWRKLSDGFRAQGDPPSITAAERYAECADSLEAALAVHVTDVYAEKEASGNDISRSADFELWRDDDPTLIQCPDCSYVGSLSAAALRVSRPETINEKMARYEFKSASPERQERNLADAGVDMGVSREPKTAENEGVKHVVGVIRAAADGARDNGGQTSCSEIALRSWADAIEGLQLLSAHAPVVASPPEGNHTCGKCGAKCGHLYSVPGECWQCYRGLTPEPDAASSPEKT